MKNKSINCKMLFVSVGEQQEITHVLHKQARDWCFFYAWNIFIGAGTRGTEKYSTSTCGIL